MPSLLILAELFLTVICISYVLKIAGLIMDIAEIPGIPPMKPVALLAMDLIFLVTTVFAVLTVPSRRPESWRRVTRSCFTFTFAMVMSTTIVESTSYSHAFDFNPFVTGVLLGILFAIMLFNRKIKEFYTPPMMKVPRLLDWIIYIVYGRLFDTDYHITFDDSKDNGRSGNNGPDFGIPDEIGPIADTMSGQ